MVYLILQVTLLNAYDNDGSGQTGAFYKGNIKANNGFGFDGNYHGTASATHFNASKSNSIYDKSSYVQPKSVSIVPILKY